VKHEPCNVGRFAQVGISDHVEVDVAAQAQRVADAMAACFLQVEDALKRTVELVRRVQGEYV